MVREIVIYGSNPVLREKCKPVGEVTYEIRELSEDMIDTMIDAKGVGLAQSFRESLVCKQILDKQRHPIREH
ncbi:MAG: hypothetical protein F6K10_19525 [Moorea sp. SIO2B7]|nr:hypothetical protein [Moorena sp. SIO2B7]